MSKERSHIYLERVTIYTQEQKKYVWQLSLISMLRLLIFLFFAWFLYSAFSQRFMGHDLVYSICSIVGFLVCVFWAAGLKRKIKFLQQLVLINENEKAISNGSPSCLYNGASLEPLKGFAVDLTIFGNHSLFHLLNRAGSESGKRQLANRLIKPFINRVDIENYQGCVKELAGNIHFRQTLLAHTLLLEEEEVFSKLQSDKPENNFSVLQSKSWSLLALWWPIAGLAIIVFCIWQDSYLLMLAFGILGLLLLSFILKKVNVLYADISKRSYLYTQYARCFQLINEEIFRHPYLIERQRAITEAGRAFQKLSRLVGLFDLRLNAISFIINGLFLFDLLCARAYMKWNAEYQSFIQKWFDTMGEMELLNSLATFHFNQPSFIFPDCTEDRLLIHAKALGHPLMDEADAVVNDISIGKPAKLHLITGSNMSGKSTFLRTLGLNMVLAQLGAPVFAHTFVFRPVRVLTSFHHIDSLEEGTSYFYAELKCLQGIIASLQEPTPALVLLDEIMRGTNSTDKHDGTALLIKKILNYSCLTLIATHDTELGVLAEGQAGDIENFCFESELSDKGLVFDFTMRKGVAQTRNATYLMQQMGII